MRREMCSDAAEPPSIHARYSSRGDLGADDAGYVPKFRPTGVSAQAARAGLAVLRCAMGVIWVLRGLFGAAAGPVECSSASTRNAEAWRTSRNLSRPPTSRSEDISRTSTRREEN